MSLEDAIKVTHEKYKFKDVRTRIQSKAIAWILCQALKEAVAYIEHLENKIKELEQK
jgi:hypothetical protein